MYYLFYYFILGSMKIGLISTNLCLLHFRLMSTLLTLSLRSNSWFVTAADLSGHFAHLGSPRQVYERHVSSAKDSVSLGSTQASQIFMWHQIFMWNLQILKYWQYIKKKINTLQFK